MLTGDERVVQLSRPVYELPPWFIKNGSADEVPRRLDDNRPAMVYLRRRIAPSVGQNEPGTSPEGRRNEAEFAVGLFVQLTRCDCALLVCPARGRRTSGGIPGGDVSAGGYLRASDRSFVAKDDFSVAQVDYLIFAATAGGQTALPKAATPFSVGGGAIPVGRL